MPSRTMPALEKNIWRAIGAIENAAERKLLTNYKIALDQIRVVLSKTYEKYAINGVLTHAEMSKFNRLMGLQTQLTEIMGPVYTKNAALTSKLAAVEYEQAFYRYEWALDQNSGVALKWGKLNPATVKAAVTNDLAKIAKKGIRQDGLLGIQRTVTQGLIQGQSFPKMARGLKASIERSASGYMTIARTEGQRSAVLGQIAQADESERLGIDVKRIWDATLDSRTRPEHGQLDGQAADEDGMFHTSVGLVSGPLQSGDPGFDIQCRCRLREEVADYPPEVRRIRGEGIQPYITYNEWAKKKGI